MSRIILAVFVAVMAISTSVFAQWERNSCASTVQRTLSEAGVASSDISDIAYIRERAGGDDDRIVGYNAWVRLKSCRSGYVVVNLNRDCHLIQIYTDGACRVSGVKQG